MSDQPPAEDVAALVGELRAKAHASTRHKTRGRSPTPLKEHVCWRAADRLEASQALSGEREGWVLVPVEATPEMVHAAYANQPNAINAGFAWAYRDMVAAAPKPR